MKKFIDEELLEHTTVSEVRREAELKRLRETRDKEGDPAWAKLLGLIIADIFNNLTLKDPEETEYSRELLLDLSHHLEDLIMHKTLSNPFVIGFIETLVSWGYTNLKYSDIMIRRTRKESHRRKRD